MRFALAAIFLAAVAGASAQSTVLAACGTACPTGPAPDVMVTRTTPPMSSGTACPSLLVSSMAGNGTNPTVASPTPTAFAGGANQIAGSIAAIMAAAVALAL